MHLQNNNKKMLLKVYYIMSYRDLAKSIAKSNMYHNFFSHI